MMRRNFLKNLTGQALAMSATGNAYAFGEKKDGTNYTASKSNNERITKIGNRTLEEIRDIFSVELYENTIPLWKKNGVDWKFGAYWTRDNVNEKYEVISTDKGLYDQARVLWLFSCFYNYFDPDEFNLRAAKAGFDFLSKYFVDDEYNWFHSVERDGRPIIKNFSSSAVIFAILGLGEYFKASGDEEALHLAVKTAHRFTEIILTPSYTEGTTGGQAEPGTPFQGTWLHFLSSLTPLLRYTKEPKLEMIALMCVRNLLQHHYQPDLGYAYEILQPDFTPHKKDDYLQTYYARSVSPFHSIQAAWMIMDEALRVGNTGMFTDGMNFFGRNLLERFWVDRNGEQGLIGHFWPDRPDYLETKINSPYVMKEVFVTCLYALEHTHEKWAAEWFDRAFSYSYGKPLDWPYRDTLHQPRGLMLSIRCLDRMIERDGKVSDFFS